MSNESYKLLCTINNDFKSHDDNFGKLDAHFELRDKQSVTLVNQGDFFCETEQLFVTAGFAELRKKFGERLFIAECIPNKSTERKADDCAFVTNADHCEEARGILACEVYHTPLPPTEQPVISVPEPPATRSITLQHDGFFYGPFSYEIAENAADEFTLTLKASSTATKVADKKVIDPFFVAKIEAAAARDYLRHFGNDNRQLVGGLKKLMQSCALVDFISDDQLISLYGNKLAASPVLRGFTKNSVSLVRKHFHNLKDFAANRGRFSRLLKTLESSTKWESHRNELLDELLKKSSGQAILESYIESNRHRYFQSETDQFEKDLKVQFSALQSSITTLKKDKEQVESDIRKKRRELDALDTGEVRQAIEQEKNNRLDSLLEEKKEKLQSYDHAITEMAARHKIMLEYDELKSELRTLQSQRDYIRDEKSRMERERDRVADELHKDNDKLVSELLKLKPQVDALYGLHPSRKKAPKRFDVSTVTTTTESDTDKKRDDFIERVQESLEHVGRKTDYNSIVNILTTVAQSQFTLFSGLPGTGKTSFAKLLGQAMGLGNRLLTIPVARGWTSSRNILGFYNALSQSFLPASTGLYELLQHLRNESEHAAPAIILLDEFNLSQPEHYFSPFMEMADPESDRTILTGDPEQPALKVPDYLRFLGTINHDETVQGLSPRMLDRSAVIQFDDIPQLDALSFKKSNSDSSIPAQCPISGTEFISLFSPTALDLPDETQAVLTEITQALREDTIKLGTPVIVSFRKIKAIASYCNAASPLITRSSALDYAVSQHIIPLLNGHGHTFGERLKALSNVIPEELERSQHMLNHIIETGSRNMHSYGYNL